MKIYRWLILLMILWVAVACAVSPTATPTPSPTLTPSATVLPLTSMELLPTPVGSRRAPSDMPACREAQSLAEPVEFAWAGIEDIIPNVPESNWTFYRCNDSPVGVSAFYRQGLPQFHWVQMRWEERADATLGIFYNSSSAPSIPNRWLYLWILPDSSIKPTSYLAVAWWEAPKSC